MIGLFNALEDVAGVAKPWWLRALPYVAVVTWVAVSGFGLYHHGYDVAATKYNGIISEANKVHADELISLQRQVADAEHAAQAQAAAIDQHYQEAIANEKQSTDRTINDLRTGAISLRKRLAAITITAAGMPCTATSAGCGDGAATVGLQAEDAALLVRLSAEADAIVQQLNACQAVVRADRAVVVK